jgi:hypothetical protein
MLIRHQPTQHWPGHEYGSSWLAYDAAHMHSFVYVNIPKNASTWMTDAMGSATNCCGFNYLNNSFTGSHQSWHAAAREAKRTYLVLLRDPVSRWLSGLAQNQIGIDPTKPRHYSQMGWDRVLEKVVFDDHTEPQASFVSGIDTRNIVWFWVDHTLSEQVRAWSRDNLTMTLPDMDHDHTNRYNRGHLQTAQWFAVPRSRHRLQGSDFSSIVQAGLQYLQQNPAGLDRLRDFYHFDYTLIRHADFYHATSNV